MTPIKLIKYPGAKTALIPQIDKSFNESKSEVLVDVFGGSGVVPLNINARHTIYNDLNKELYGLFSVIKSNSKEFYDFAEEWTRTKPQFLKYMETLNSNSKTNLNVIEKAFRTFYKFNIGFGGMGSTYKTKKEKSSYSSMRKILSNFEVIRGKVSEWNIENLDFRELIRNYGGKNVFFYCDPPYSGKSWYEFTFNIKDLEELKKISSKIVGKYLFTFDYNDQNVRKIFGEPNHVTESENTNNRTVVPEMYRKFSFYYYEQGKGK